MDTLLVVLRLLHILLGVFWAGALIFVALFLLPAIGDTGPDGGKVMAALQRRQFTNIMPILALITIISGFWLYYIVSGGFNPDYMGSKYGVGYGLGGASAILALAIGLIVIRPAANRAGTIMGQLANAPAGAERDSLLAEAGKMRAKAGAGSKIVAVLLAFTVVMMAITRYM